jgi:hypothetical protein
MPAVQAIGVVTDRPPPFRLPVLDDRGDVAARLAAMDSMIIDESGRRATSGDVPTGPASARRADGDTISDRPPRTPETAFPASAGAASAEAAKSAIGISAVSNSTVGMSAVSNGAVGKAVAGAGGRHRDPGVEGVTSVASGRVVPADASNNAGREGGEAPRGARVRAAATVPARARMLRPDGVQAAAPATYTADDWRGHIKGTPARADAHVYGAAGGPASAMPAEAILTTPFTGTTTPTGDSSEHRMSGRREATARAESAETAKRVSILDRAARIGLLGALLAIFVLLFIFGPKISQWWGTL